MPTAVLAFQMRARHPKKEVESALKSAEEHGWTVEPKRKSGHSWGSMRCPAGECRESIWSTPRNTGDHANDLRRAVARCDHG